MSIYHLDPHPTLSRCGRYPRNVWFHHQPISSFREQPDKDSLDMCILSVWVDVLSDIYPPKKRQ
jgi:hypothetical protein